MKDRIYRALKQEFANLGLGDDILKVHADGLATSGLITDENFATSIQGQMGILKAFQRSFDRLRSENAKYRKELRELKVIKLSGDNPDQINSPVNRKNSYINPSVKAVPIRNGGKNQGLKIKVVTWTTVDAVMP